MEGEPLYDQQWYFLSFTVMRLLTLLCMAVGAGIVVTAALGGEPVLLAVLALLPLAWLVFAKTSGRICKVHASEEGLSVQGLGIRGTYPWSKVPPPRLLLHTGGLLRASISVGEGRNAEFVCSPVQWERLAALQGTSQV
jgi:hypothetical protein